MDCWNILYAYGSHNLVFDLLGKRVRFSHSYFHSRKDVLFGVRDRRHLGIHHQPFANYRSSWEIQGQSNALQCTYVRPHLKEDSSLNMNSGIDGSERSWVSRSRVHL